MKERTEKKRQGVFHNERAKLSLLQDWNDAVHTFGQTVERKKVSDMRAGLFVSGFACSTSEVCKQLLNSCSFGLGPRSCEAKESAKDKDPKEAGTTRFAQYRSGSSPDRELPYLHSFPQKTIPKHQLIHSGGNALLGFEMFLRMNIVEG